MRSKNELLSVLDRIAVRTMNIMEIDACGIWLKNKKGHLIPQVCHGINAESANFIFSGDSSVLRYVLETKIPSQIYNLSEYGGKDFTDFVKEEKLKSLLACPIYVKGENVGLLTILTKNRPRRFTQIDKLLFSTLVDEAAFVIRNQNLSNRIKMDYLNTIRTIAHILEANDRYTYGHSNKVMKYAVSICGMLKLKKEGICLIKNAALLHDIGKIGIDSGILKKKGRLTIYEWEEIKKHPLIGSEILGQTSLLNNLAPIIEHHHERYGGGGYPDPGLKGENIPLGAKIIAIADAYDAMTSERPYRENPLTMDMALSEIKKNAGKQFDPELAKIFADYMTKEMLPVSI